MGFSDYLSTAFPGIRITSGKRDPNSALGRANPKSYHNVGMAWDVAPIPGMTFDQYKSRVEQDGWNVREAIDEVNHPSKHATGPHWHMAVDGRKEQQPMAGTSLASLMQSAYSPPQQKVAGLDVSQPTSLASYLQAPLTNEALKPAQMPQQPSFVEMAPVAGVKPKGRGTANDIMGSIFDALAAAGGAQPVYWASVLGDQQEQKQQGFRQQQLETEGRQRLAERQAERAATMQQWIAQQDWKKQNPDPTSMENDLAAWNRMTPEQRATYAQMQDVKSPIAVSQPNGSVVRVPRAYGAPQPQAQSIDGRHYVKVGDQWMEVTE